MLKACWECGGQVSSNARQCPHCGVDPSSQFNRDPVLTERTSKEHKLGMLICALGAIAGVVLLVIHFNLPDRSKDPPALGAALAVVGTIGWGLFRIMAWWKTG